ncbi:hypothetical protein M501DRAFT_1015201 [Patellaria atrata CBS 101060]|uniref:Lysine-specific metallo-endopeptidase domain-containing protein n=1 Tax=Patellaria atrata CBS 101060 TaxID=1346257 RepID=A0A9P4SEG4_9PEZI|nr:hypothetical protein M501DRAFT_1015201 [Patellaria atrata CBS 101060]
MRSRLPFTPILLLSFSILAVALPTFTEGKSTAHSIVSRQAGPANDIELTGFEGCDEASRQAIEDAWDSMLEIADSVKGNVRFSGYAERDFLGHESLNYNYQSYLKTILEQASTFRKGDEFVRPINVRCDDFLNRGAIDPVEDCPAGTRRADYRKCRSRCWRAYSADGRTTFSAGARVYTNSQLGSSAPLATINFCPGFFSIPTCESTIQKYGTSTNNFDRLEMWNYQCKGYAVLHELFHIREFTQRLSPESNEVLDRTIRVREPGGQFITKQAYSPVFTKVLAHWTQNTGYWVSTNADNLAQYSLAKYVESRIGEYPRHPVVFNTDFEQRHPTRFARSLSQRQSEEIPPFTEDGTAVAITDLNVLASALMVTPEEALTLYDATELGCSDANTETSCVDAATNPPIDLDATADDSWNIPDATEDGPPRAAEPTASPTPSPSLTCNGLSNNKYIAQADLAVDILDFCGQAAAQGVQDVDSGSIDRTYHQGTPSEVHVAIDWPSGSSWTPNQDECISWMNHVSDDCDGNDPNNPMNWKGGGTIQLGEVTYRISPVAPRHPFPKAVGGHIECSGLKFWLSGNGWANIDWGKRIFDEFNGCLGSGYDFSYGLGDDGREWTATGWMGPGQGNCVHNAILTAGGPDIYCS